MKPEDKEILLKDLCARLPYGVKFACNKNIYIAKGIDLLVTDEGNWEYAVTAKDIVPIEIDFIKPYLFPLSSMTDKELTEFLQIKGMNLNSDELKTFRRGETAIVSTLSSYSRHIDWLNAHHFDYRGLIDKSLALDATRLNIY